MDKFRFARYFIIRNRDAILLTGYLGGATAAHVRISDPFFMPVVLGVLVWGGLFLRDGWLCALIPLRS